MSKGAPAPAATPPVQSQPSSLAKGAAAVKSNLPEGWNQTTAERQWEDNDISLFGAKSFEQMKVGSPLKAGFVPGDAEVVDPGDKGPDVNAVVHAIQEEAGEKAAPKPRKPKAEKPVEAAGLEVDEDGVPIEPVTVEAETTEETSEEADPAAETPKPEPEAPATDSSSMVRRRALAALKADAEKRQLEERLTAEQTARAAERADWERRSQERQDTLEAIRKKPLGERLKALGIDSQEAVQEAFLRGELKDLPETAPAAGGDPDRMARLENELAISRRDNSIQSVLNRERSGATVEQVVAEAARTWVATGAKAEDQVTHINNALATIINGERVQGAALSAVETEIGNTATYPAPFVRATPGALDAVKATALSLWREAGGKPGDLPKYTRFAVQAAEEMYAEKYEPLRPLFGGPAATAKPGAKPAPGAKPKASPPIGSRVAGAAPVDPDEGPMDPSLRQAWVKEQAKKKGMFVP